MPATDIDALIEDGLTRYGRGDLAGALLVWEEALRIEPDNEQAKSYVDYVRQNYDMLSGSELISDEANAPFGIEDDEYVVEIIETTPLAPATARPPDADALDDGWFIDDSAAVPDPARAMSRELPVVVADAEVVEINADEPPETGPAGDPHAPDDDDDPEIEIGVSAPVPLAAADLSSGDLPAAGHTPGFGEAEDPEESTPVGFASQATELRVRSLGFVKPVEAKPVEPNRFPSNPPTEPEPEPEPEPAMTTPMPEPPKRPTRDKIETAFGSEATATEHSAIGPKPTAPADPEHEDNDDVIPPPSPSALTRELPHGLQLPVFADERNRTRDLSWEIGQDQKPTQELLIDRLAGMDSAEPIRELGMRATLLDRTARADPRSAGNVSGAGVGDTTRADVVLPFDPMDARAAQMLEEVDERAPAQESREDRTRRRITALIEKSAYWQRNLDLERSVAAIDLALAEEPNSALAQKLIHRNRDAIMTAFQSYIGDLSRAPLLARPLHELASAPISPRAAFLLSRVDGTMSIDEILDVSGMPRLEAFRYLSQLLLRGILK